MALKRILLGAGLALALAGAAMAQVITVPLVQSLSQSDLVQVVPKGQPSAQSQYIAPGAIGGLWQYSQQTPLTAFTITPPAHTSLLYLTPAATLATGTVTFEPTPSDGQNFCFQSTQINTAITFTANSGQSFGGIANPTTYGTANVRLCWFYNANTATWYHIQ